MIHRSQWKSQCVYVSKISERAISIFCNIVSGMKAIFTLFYLATILDFNSFTKKVTSLRPRCFAKV